MSDTNAATKPLAIIASQRDLVGRWESKVRDTKNGPMTFSFQFGEDGELNVTGTPTGGSHTEVFQRSGPYPLNGEELVSSALNEGQPVQLRIQAGVLILRIDESLVFHLRRK